MMHQETIYDLIPVEKIPVKKPPRHESKFRDNVKQEIQERLKSHKTMGPAKVSPPDTQNFVKKHTRDFIPTDNRDFKYPDADHTKPQLPGQRDVPLMGLKTTKNFITTNAVENITSVPKKPAMVYVDKCDGHKNMLVPSGLEPVYVHKKDFGETPKYIEERKKEEARAQKEYDNYVSEYFRRGAMKQLSETERDEILTGLKANWQAIHHDYLNLSVVTDTVPKKHRKERMEMEMKQLERDISIVDKHSRIYIAN